MSWKVKKWHKRLKVGKCFFLQKKSWSSTTQRASMWAKGVGAFTFHKKTNISPTNANATGQLWNRWKGLNIFLVICCFLKLLHEGASILLPQCWNCKNLTTSPKTLFLFRCLENSNVFRSGWTPLPSDFSSKETTYVFERRGRHKLFFKAKITHKFHIPLQCELPAVFVIKICKFVAAPWSSSHRFKRAKKNMLHVSVGPD